MNDFTIDRRVLDAPTVFGHFLGALGALYLAYDFFRPSKFLHRLTSTGFRFVAALGFLYLAFVSLSWLGPPPELAPYFSVIFSVIAGVLLLTLVLISLVLLSDQEEPPHHARPLRPIEAIGGGAIFGLLVGIVVAVLSRSQIPLEWWIILVLWGVYLGVVTLVLEKGVAWSVGLTDRQLGGDWSVADQHWLCSARRTASGGDIRHASATKRLRNEHEAPPRRIG